MAVHPRYLFAAATIFLVEIAIAKGYPPIPFVRSSVGDVFVIMLIYCFLRGVTNLSRPFTAIISFVAGIVVECLQFLHLAERFDLTPGSAAFTMLGNTFSSADLLMYAIGAMLAFAADAKLATRP